MIRPRIPWISLAIVLAGASGARATDPPHWTSASTVEDCNTSCHAVHAAVGGTLTTWGANVNLCQSCHQDAGSASSMPLPDADRANPSLDTGTSHSFGVSATNAAFGALPPNDLQRSLRVMGGNIVCSTCHNQHAARQSSGAPSHLSAAAKIVTTGGGGTVSSGGSYTGTLGVWYLLEIDGQGSQSTATFQWSKDNGTTWMATGVSAGNGSPVTLDNGITVIFSGGAGNAFQLTERWQFYASYPFIRGNVDSGDNTTGDLLCRDCHRDWVMVPDDVRTYDGSVKSHPVGLPLAYNGDGRDRSYDRPVPLDANGATQGSGSADANETNDLRLDSTNRVQCYSCHGIHFADSNSQTVDGPAEGGP